MRLAVASLAFAASCAPPAGALHGPCRAGNACNDGLTCVDKSCVVLVEAGEGEGARPAGEGEGEGASQQECPTNRRVCDSDRVCAGGFCDKTHDSADGVTGDGIPAANDPLGCCVILLCTTDADCDAGEICDVARGACLPASSCDPTVPATTPGNACAAGTSCVWSGDAPSCAAASSLPQADSCELASTGAVFVEGEHIPLSALALFAGHPSPYATFTFSVDTGSVDGSGRFTGCAGPAPCDVTVTAHVTGSNVTCSGVERVLPALAAGNTRVVVVDAITHAPLANVAVQAAAGGSAITATTTDGNGIATFAFGAADFVSALPLDHDWHTIEAPPEDVIIATRATPDASKVRGKDGTLDGSLLHTTGDFSLGVAGIALPSSVDVDLAGLVGFPAQYPVRIEGITDGPLALASTEEMSLGDTTLKGDWLALDAGADRTIAWALEAKVALADFGGVLSQAVNGGSANNNSAAQLLLGTVGVLANADHAFTSISVDSDAAPGGDPSNPQAPIPNAEYPFTPIALQPSTQSALERVLSWPVSSPKPDALVAAFARVPGRGLVVLGASSTFGVLQDGGISGNPDTPEVLLGFAPPHDGLEGAPVQLAAVAIDHAAVTDDPKSIAVAASFLDPSTTTVPSFETAVQGSFNGGVFTSTNDAGADVYRVQLDASGGRWFVWSTSPPAFDVATLTDGSLGVRADRARVESMSLSAPFASIVSGDFGSDLASIDARVTKIASEPCFAGSTTCTAN